jgi:hypothetical protein
MKPVSSAIAATLLGWGVLTSNALAQTASLTARTNELSPNGGEITLQAALGYNERPAALGWSIPLPAGWSMVRVGGGEGPQVVPEPGTTGTLEFAYTSVPDYMASFAVTVRYPAGSGGVKISPTVIVRTVGKLITLTPAPVSLHQP